jgi:hypothetical protein
MQIGPQRAVMLMVDGYQALVCRPWHTQEAALLVPKALNAL